jgi:hypothetical protein
MNNGGKARTGRDADHSPHLVPRSISPLAPAWRLAGRLLYTYLDLRKHISHTQHCLTSSPSPTQSERNRTQDCETYCVQNQLLKASSNCVVRSAPRCAPTSIECSVGPSHAWGSRGQGPGPSRYLCAMLQESSPRFICRSITLHKCHEFHGINY